MRRTIFLLLCITVFAGFLFAQEDTVEIAPGSVLFDDIYFAPYAQTESLRLYVNEELVSFIVEDLRSGKIWTSFVPTYEAEYQKTNRVWQRNMGSLFTFTVVNLNDDRASKRNLNLLSLKRDLQITKLPSGVRLQFYFVDYQIGITVELTIEDDAINFRIPADGLVEDTSLAFTSITPMPFFGYAKSSDEGYMVIPDGCGAIYNFKPTESGSGAKEKLVSWYVYAPEKVDFERYWEMRSDLINTAYMPIFGAKNGNTAFIASIDEGDTDAYINFYESGFSVDLNRISAEFVIRHSYELHISEIAVETALAGQNLAPVRFDADRIEVDRTVRYELLNDENATYGGMAREYRHHLQQTGVLTKTTMSDEVPLGLSLFGGIIEDRLLFDKYVAMTTFSEATEIIKELTDRDVNTIYANYIGWSKHGYGVFPRMWPPDRGIGGRSGLKRLGKSLVDYAVTFYLQVDPVQAVGNNGRFSKRNDTVKQKTKVPVRDEYNDTYFLNPEEALERVDSTISKLRDYGIDGLSYESIGDVLFHDYNSRFPAARHETLGVWQDMLDHSTENLGSAALIRGNIRQANKAEIIYELPMEASGYLVVDEAIPFYQMVLHGSIYYTTDPENLFYDTQKQYLQWIETGAIPYYVLTYKRSENLAFTRYNHLFTSYYADWIDVAAARYRDFNEEFGDFYHLEMVEHARVNDSTIRVEYADGSRIYVNYGNEADSVDGITIEPLDYRVVRAGAVAMGSDK